MYPKKLIKTETHENINKLMMIIIITMFIKKKGKLT